MSRSRIKLMIPRDMDDLPYRTCDLEITKNILKCQSRLDVQRLSDWSIKRNNPLREKITRGLQMKCLKVYFYTNIIDWVSLYSLQYDKQKPNLDSLRYPTQRNLIQTLLIMLNAIQIKLVWVNPLSPDNVRLISYKNCPLKIDFFADICTFFKAPI